MTTSTRKDNTSHFTGVSWHRRDKRWQAQIRVKGKLVYLGLFSSSAMAAKAYDDAASALEREKKDPHPATNSTGKDGRLPEMTKPEPVNPRIMPV